MCFCVVLVFIHTDIICVCVSPQCRGLSTSLSWPSGPSGSGASISSPPSVTSCGETPSTWKRPTPLVSSWRRKYVGAFAKDQFQIEQMMNIDFDYERKPKYLSGHNYSTSQVQLWLDSSIRKPSIIAPQVLFLVLCDWYHWQVVCHRDVCTRRI